MTDIQWTFGPVIVRQDGADKLTAKCILDRFVCRGYHGGKCSWQKHVGKIPASNETPDSCKYKEGALRDAAEMADRD